MFCPGCGQPFTGQKGVPVHLKRTDNKKCRRAYRKIVGIDPDSETDTMSPISSSDSDAEDLYPRAVDEPEDDQDMDGPIDVDPNYDHDSDFFGSFHENEDFYDEIEFNINVYDISLDLDDIPGLEEEPDSKDEDEYIWYRNDSAL